MSQNFGQTQFQRRQFKHKASDAQQKAIDYDALRKKIRLPAYGLIVTGGLSLLLTLGGAVFGISYSSIQSEGIKNDLADAMFGPMEDLSLGTNVKAVNKRIEEARQKRKNQAQVVVTLITGGVFILALVLGVVYTIALTGGIMMMRFKNYKLCKLACTMAMIPIVSPLVVLGIPFGVWGLSRLAQADIKKAFL